MFNSYNRLQILSHGGRKEIKLCVSVLYVLQIFSYCIRLHSFSQWHRQESDFQPVIKYGWWIKGLALLKGPDARTV